MSQDKIRIENLYKIFGANPEAMLPLVKDGISKQELMEKHDHVLGLNNINITVPEREISVIMGLSGSGKSTLVRHINRLIEPTAGEVYVDGDDVLKMSNKQLKSFRRSKASMVFQRFGLLVHNTVAENVAYGLRIKGMSKKDANEKSDYWIKRVGLEGFEKHYPAQLSGGMQQRVGLARALATDADILLMDEAFSALDPLIRYDMQSILLELQEELHKTIVFITHDLDEALRIGNKVSILRDGELVQEGTAQQIILQPSDDYIFDFVKDINRARVLNLQAVMGHKTPCEGPSMSYDTLLEDALQKAMATPEQAVNVIGRDNQHMGVATLTSIVKAVARPEITTEQQSYY